MITVSNVSVQFGGTTLFKNVNLKLALTVSSFGVLGAIIGATISSAINSAILKKFLLYLY